MAVDVDYHIWMEIPDQVRDDVLNKFSKVLVDKVDREAHDGEV